MRQRNQTRSESPLLEIEGSEGCRLFIRLVPYGQTIRLWLPEAVAASPKDPVVPPPGFHYSRVPTSSHELGADGFWEFGEDNGQLQYISRSKVAESGERLDIKLTFVNRTAHDWGHAGAAPCLAPPPAFQDDGLRRTYVVDFQGKLRVLGELVDGYNYNVISVRGGTEVGPLPGMDPQWRYHNLWLADVEIMTEANDGRYTLVKAFETASCVCTGFHGPCIHSQAVVWDIPAGGQKSVRGIVALVAGHAADGYACYLRWRESLAPQAP